MPVAKVPVGHKPPYAVTGIPHSQASRWEDVMKAARTWALVGSVGLAVSFTAVAAGQAVAKPTPNRISLRGSLTPAAERAHPAGTVARGTRFSFDLLLKLRNAAGAKKFV